MKNLLLLLICLLCFGTQSFSQPFEMGIHGNYFLTGGGSPADFQHYSIETTPGGEYVLAGAIDPFTGSTLTHIHLMKLDATGNQLWSREISGFVDDAALDVMVEPNGNIVLTGYVSAASNAPEMYITKYDPSGTLLGQRIITGFPEVGSVGTNIIRSSSGTYIIGGFFSETPVSYPLTSGQAVLIEVDPNTLNPISTCYLSKGVMSNGHTSINDIIEIPGTGYFATGSYEKSNGTLGVLAVILDYSLNVTTDLSCYFSFIYDERGVSALYDPALDEIFMVSNNDGTKKPLIYRIINASGAATIFENYGVGFFEPGLVPIQITEGSAFQLIESPWDPSKLIIAGRFKNGPIGTGTDNTNWLIEIDKTPWTLSTSDGIMWDMPSSNYATFAPTPMGSLFSTFTGWHSYIYNSEIVTNRGDNAGVVIVAPTSDIIGSSYGFDVVSTNNLNSLGCYEKIIGQISDENFFMDPIESSSGAPIGIHPTLGHFFYNVGQDWICNDPSLPRLPVFGDGTDGAEVKDPSAIAFIDEATIDLTIAPNPSADIFTVTFRENVKGQFTITNSVGQIVYRSAQINGADYTESIDFSEFESGTYIFQFTNENERIIKKLIKM